ncbi:MAG: plastocyanin/azurin family copper-binding protein [Halorientalis sp.]
MRPTDGGEGGAQDLAALAVERRRLLATLGTAGVAALAGCSGQDSDGVPTTDTRTPETDTTTMQQQTQTPQQTQDGGSSDVHDRFGRIIGPPGMDGGTEADHEVRLDVSPRQDRELPEFYFDPAGLAVEPGDTVQFTLATPHHNVNAYHPDFGYNQRVPDGVPPFSSPVLTAGDAWLYTFETEGVHDIMCAPHELFGMVGRVVVGSPTGPGATPVGDAPGTERSRPPEYTAGLVLSDDALAPSNIVERGRVPWSAIADRNKRLLLAPVES